MAKIKLQHLLGPYNPKLMNDIVNPQLLTNHNNTELVYLPSIISFNVVFRNTMHRILHYDNITPDYNGTAIVSDEFVKYPHNLKVYDNSHYIHNDYTTNILPPTNMLAIFPKRQFDTHRVTITYTEDTLNTYRKIYNNCININEYRLSKYLSIDEIKQLKKSYVDIKASNTIPEAVIFNNLLKVDYIDHRCTIILNGRLLFPDKDYEILCSNLIKITNEFELQYNFKYENDKIQAMELIIESDQVISEDLINNSRNKSKLYKLYNDPEVLAVIFDTDTMSDINYAIDNKIFNKDYGVLPPLYNEELYRHNIMLTKYFSTESVLEGDAVQYGLNWLHDLITEFPEFSIFIGLDSDMRWKDIDGYNYTWEEIDNGALFKDMYNAYYIRNDLPEYNLYNIISNYVENGILNRDKVSTILKDLYIVHDSFDKNTKDKILTHWVNTIIREYETILTQQYDERTRIKIDDFNYKYTRTNGEDWIIADPRFNPDVYTAMDETKQLNRIRFNKINFKKLYNKIYNTNVNEDYYNTRGMKVRYPSLPERTPLNTLLTNHMIFVSNYMKDMKFLHGPYQFNYVMHDNNTLVRKDKFLDNTLPTPGARNILYPLIDEDSALLPSVPINYVSYPYRQVYNPLDADYIRPSDAGRYVDENKIYLLTPEPTKDDGYRYVNIYLPESLFVKERHYHKLSWKIKDSTNNSKTLRDLITELGEPYTNLLNKWVGFKYLYNDPIANIREYRDLSLDTNLNEVNSGPVGDSTYTPFTLYPEMKYKTIHINMGKDNNSNNYSVEFKLYDTVALDEVFQDIPHLHEDYSILANQDVYTAFNRKYPNININTLKRYTNNDITYYSENGQVRFINRGNGMMNPIFIDDTEAKPINLRVEYRDDTSTDIYLEWYTYDPNFVEVDSKPYRICGDNRVYCTLTSPKFRVPIDKYELDSIDTTNLLDNSYYLDDSYIDEPFNQYMLNNLTNNDIYPVIPDYMEYIYSDKVQSVIEASNKYIVGYTKDNNYTELDLTNYIPSNRFDRMSDTISLLIDKDNVSIYDNTIGITYSRPIPIYLNKGNIKHSTIYNYKTKGKDKLALMWFGDNDIKDEYIQDNELLVYYNGEVLGNNVDKFTRDKNDTRIDIDALKGISYNALNIINTPKVKIFKMEHNIYVYNANTGKYDTIIEEYDNPLSNNFTTHDDFNLDRFIQLMKQPTAKYIKLYTHSGSIKYVRLIDTDVVLHLIVNKYLDILNKQTNDIFKIRLINDPNGSLDYSRYYDKFNDILNSIRSTNWKDIAVEVIKNWSNIYGKYMNKVWRTNGDVFSKSKSIDVILAHPNIKLEIELIKTEDNIDSISHILTPNNNTRYYTIENDDDFIPTIRVGFIDLLRKFINTIPVIEDGVIIRDEFDTMFSNAICSVTLYNYRGQRLDVTFNNNPTNIYDILSDINVGHINENGFRAIEDIPTIRLSYRSDNIEFDKIRNFSLNKYTNNNR